MYQGFARVYDRLIAGIRHADFLDYYKRIFKRLNIQPTTILELGCGTGRLTKHLAEDGYDITALDISKDMLAIAERRCRGRNVLFLNQDMASFQLYGTVDVICSSLDCVNYLTRKNQLLSMMNCANTFLNPGGIFIFDINTFHKYQNVLNGNTFYREKHDSACIWENHFTHPFCNIYLTFFTENDSGLFIKGSEHHIQRAYTKGEIIRAGHQAALEFIACWDKFNFLVPSPTSDRVFFVFRKRSFHE